MRRWSGAILLGLALPPLLAPAVELLRNPAAFRAFGEWDRLLSLLSNTFALASGAALIAAPFGAIVGLMLARGPLFARRYFEWIVLVALFVPLPVTAIAWQAVLGGWLPSFAMEPGAVSWRAWNTGLLPAIWVHGMAGLPAVAWVVAEIARQTDRDLEDEARLLGGGRTVFRWVILPRVLRAGLAGTLWVVVQAGTEIPIADAMMVRTYAEEVYTQAVGSSGTTSAVALALPLWLAGIAVMLPMLKRVKLSANLQPVRGIEFTRKQKGLGTVGLAVVSLAFAGVPLFALILKTSGDRYSLFEFFNQLIAALRANGLLLLNSLLWAAVAGVITATLARWACAGALKSRWFGTLFLILGVSILLMPGPILGLGLKSTIEVMLNIEDWLLLKLQLQVESPPLASLLYYNPSPIPSLWIAIVRLLPLAGLLIWPSLRSIPRELFEAARLAGKKEWSLVIAPQTNGAYFRAILAVAAFALGEVSAGKLVAPPSYETFIVRLFALMHYGAESTVAALALVQLAVSAALASAVGFWRRSA